ncbi:hypothetical protein [Deinococcus roseus]|uniref:Uncharacterized protein n=1 Tax=Deinococcus roseus TaxID=392414 RepID=A0ABQ2CUP5_9DEIO|nr:hypothetical protein [Deinococcus roseus]GGJ19321.1 hypothetical protein GCM10008938_01760 [Deinococcus roseus]
MKNLHLKVPLLLVCTVLLSGCTFISFPLIPDPVSVELPVLPRTEGLVLQDKTLLLKVSIPSGEGYLGVIWYQQDKELGRESVYIDEKIPEVTFKQEADPAKPYRVVLLYQKRIIRQYEYVPPQPAKTEDDPKTDPEPDKTVPATEAPPTDPTDPPTDPPSDPAPTDPTGPSDTPQEPPQDGSP